LRVGGARTAYSASRRFVGRAALPSLCAARCHCEPTREQRAREALPASHRPAAGATRRTDSPSPDITIGHATTPGLCDGNTRQKSLARPDRRGDAQCARFYTSRHPDLLATCADLAAHLAAAASGAASSLRLELDGPIDHRIRVRDASGVLLVSDGVFSMHGRLAPLPELWAVAGRHGARLMLDEAHSVSVIGPTGRGLEEALSIPRVVDVLMGTFSKAPGAVGGYVCGSKELVDYLRFFARSGVFTASLPPRRAPG
jgi:hypothetical protein